MIDVQRLNTLEPANQPALIGPNVPENLSKIRRGSVCLIIRKKKGSQQEILLIKRTIRSTDRWSGHIALPGGKQDPGETDLETAIRESHEEVGIDLKSVATCKGALDPRFVRISWGRNITMILSCFVFSINEGFEDVQVVPQKAEVACAFWYPLNTLLDPKMESLHTIAIRDRINLSGALGSCIKSQAGDMLFPAIDIWPTLEPESSGLLPPVPWRMWGITLAIMRDFQKVLDPSFNSNIIKLPTFKAPDLRLLLALFSHFSTLQRRKHISKHPEYSDLTNRLLVGHFEFFPWVIGTGIFLRLSVAAVVAKMLFFKLREKL